MTDIALWAIMLFCGVFVPIWGVIQMIHIHRESKEMERQIDEWYERELAWLEEQMKDEDDD